MDTTGYVALSRQMALQRHMTTIANNIANAGTTGYRAEHTLFEQMLVRPAAPEPASFVQDVGLYRDTRPGAVTQTGNPARPRHQRRRLSQLPDGRQASAMAGRGTCGRTPPAGSWTRPAIPSWMMAASRSCCRTASEQITIAADGTISAGAGPFARLQLVTFDDGDLVREGGGLYRSQAVPRPATGGVVQGALEESNVAPVFEMISMLATVRAFQGVQKMLETQHELDRRAIERMISVSG